MEQFSHTHFAQNRPNLLPFDAVRALEEFRSDYPNEFQAEESAVAFNEPMSIQAKELYADLLGARAEKQLQPFVDILAEFIDEGV